ncbi:MAG: HAD hydrolase-like protein [Gemmatimonadaceae bacterium]|nr:HAD hydrolase-like protein [Gemmatimonadaceae bacterium]
MARRESLLGTLWQSAPRLGTVMRHMCPTWHMASLEQLSAPFLEREGIRGIIWDIDGTLTAYHDSRLHTDIETQFQTLLALPWLRHVVVSNSPESRFSQLGQMLPTVPILRVYGGGATRIRQLHQGVDSMSATERAAARGDDFHALRKPSRALVLAAVGALGCTVREVVMVGDQYLTDVAGAGMAGVRSIKLPTLASSSFPLSIRVAQVVERLLFLSLHGWRQPSAHQTSLDPRG